MFDLKHARYVLKLTLFLSHGLRVSRAKKQRPFERSPVPASLRIYQEEEQTTSNYLGLI